MTKHGLSPTHSKQLSHSPPIQSRETPPKTRSDKEDISELEEDHNSSECHFFSRSDANDVFLKELKNFTYYSERTQQFVKNFEADVLFALYQLSSDNSKFVRLGKVFVEKDPEKKSIFLFLLDCNRSYLLNATFGASKLIKVNNFFCTVGFDNPIEEFQRYEFPMMQFVSVSRPNTSGFRKYRQHHYKALLSPSCEFSIEKKRAVIVKMKSRPIEIVHLEQEGFRSFSLLDQYGNSKNIMVAPFFGKKLKLAVSHFSLELFEDIQGYLKSMLKEIMCVYNKNCGHVYDLKLENIVYNDETQSFHLIDWIQPSYSERYIFDKFLLQEIKTQIDSISLNTTISYLIKRTQFQEIIQFFEKTLFFNSIVATSIKFAVLCNEHMDRKEGNFLLVHVVNLLTNLEELTELGFVRELAEEMICYLQSQLEKKSIVDWIVKVDLSGKI
jgi:hypothetical protein